MIGRRHEDDRLVVGFGRLVEVGDGVAAVEGDVLVRSVAQRLQELQLHFVNVIGELTDAHTHTLTLKILNTSILNAIIQPIK